MPTNTRHPEIRIDKIPVGAGIASLLVIIVLLGTMMVELPALRWLFGLGAAAGIVLAVALILWRGLHTRRG